MCVNTGSAVPRPYKSIMTSRDMFNVPCETFVPIQLDVYMISQPARSFILRNRGTALGTVGVSDHAHSTNLHLDTGSHCAGVACSHFVAL